MNDIATGYVLLANSLRELIAVIRETRQRVLASGGLPVAGMTADDEAVHDFRVALRRCRTMLRVARTIWSTKRIKRIERELGYFARMTGKLRDDEVLRGIIASLPATVAPADEVQAWLDQRARSTRTVRRKITRIVREGPSLRETADAKGKPIRPLYIVLDNLERLIETEPMTTWSAEELATVSTEKVVRGVHHAAQSNVDDEPAMHTLRIREKRLRYTAELFAHELGEHGARLVTHATRVQRRLGELHDVDEAIATVERARGLSTETQRAIIETLRVAREACATKAEPLLIEARGLVAPLVLSSNESPPDASA